MGGTHRVFLSDVTNAVAQQGSPLTYFRGKFGRFEVEQDRIVYEELRRRILSRQIALEDSLDVSALAEELDTLPATVYHAVTKLVTDGLLARDPDRGYVVKPVTPESSEQAFDARCAMELGVAATTVGRVSQDRVAALRKLMEETVPLVSEGRFVDIDVYTRHNEAFHNAIIGLADNPTVSDAYHRLGVAGLMVSLLKQGAEAGQEVIDDHRAIVEAFERRSLDDAMRVIARHNENEEEDDSTGHCRRWRPALSATIKALSPGLRRDLGPHRRRSAICPVYRWAPSRSTRCAPRLRSRRKPMRPRRFSDAVSVLGAWGQADSSWIIEIIHQPRLQSGRRGSG